MTTYEHLSPEHYQSLVSTLGEDQANRTWNSLCRSNERSQDAPKIILFAAIIFGIIWLLSGCTPQDTQRANQTIFTTTSSIAAARNLVNSFD